MRILVSAHAATPDDAGTYAAISWNWAIALARSGEDVTVITAEQHRPTIERWLSIHREVIVSFRYVPMSGDGPFAGLIWQLRVFAVMARGDWRNFDLIHHLEPRSIRAWSFLWLLRRPFVFGPAGGGEVAPFSVLSSMGGGAVAREVLRRMVRALWFIDPVFIAMQARALRVLATNIGSRSRLWPMFRARTDIAIAVGAGPIEYNERVAAQPIRIVAAGPSGYWGGWPLFEEIGAELASRHRRYALSFEADLETAPENADIFVTLDLRDGTGATLLAAMAAGLPVVCLDRAAAPIVAGDAAAVIDVEKPSIEVVRDIADVIVRLAENPHLRREMARRSRERAALLGWERAQRNAYAPILAALRG